MGFLPVLVVLSAALMLWAMISYSSLRRYKQQAQDAETEARKLIEQIVLELDGLEISADQAKTAWLEKLEQDLLEERSLDQMLNDLKSIADIQQTFEVEETKGIQAMLLKSIADKILQINDLKRIQKAGLRSYNQLRSEKPTSYIARIFGFQALGGKA
jgi:hypothetical protein